MICKKCNKENRKIARFCKWCGEALPVATAEALDRLVGMDEIKKQIESIIEMYASLKKRPETKDIRLSLNTLIIGETGTGKTLMAQVLKDVFYANYIISSPILRVVDAVDYDKFAEDWEKNINEIKGGILFVDNAQKLLPDKYSKEVNRLDKLFLEMGYWNNDPIVILAGLPGGLEEFLHNNPAVRNRFKYLFKLPAHTPEELRDLCINLLNEKFGGLQLSLEAFEKLTRQLKYEVKTKDHSFGNGHHARQKAEDIFTSYIANKSKTPGIVQPENIPGYVPPERTLDEILNDLNEFVGMTEIKRAVEELALEMEYNMTLEKRGINKGKKPSVHIVLTGNPGTGKTTIARKLGEIFEAIGFLDSGHVVEVDRSQMVSQYMGETPKLVDKLVDRAIGGILFIDEAYTLAPVDPSGKKDELGMQALEKLMKRMEDDRGKFVVIAAGYKTEMENLLHVNPGMRSRFNRFLNIDDYTPDELFEILCTFVSNAKYKLDDDAKELARKAIKHIYATRNKNFANGRVIRTFFEKMNAIHSERVSKLSPELQTNEELTTFRKADIPFEEPVELDYGDAIKALNGLVGLKNVKEEILNLVSLVNLQTKRSASSAFAGKHYIFTGNPGTGKTTVARIMAQILKSVGLVSRGHLVEADRSMLVAGFSGQTAIKTNQLVDSAMGGILFIDEAYTLLSGENDSFGKEAIDTLLKRLEDDRGKFVCIVAGYTKEMHQFIDSNPGLKSRFTQTIHFEDYNPQELTEIFVNLVHSKKLILKDDARKAAQNLFEVLYNSRDKNFANAREVRTVFEQSLVNQSKRLLSISGLEDNLDIINELTVEDIKGENGKEQKDLQEIMEEFNEFIGMDSIKQSIHSIALQARFLKSRMEQGLGGAENIPINIVLTGNPGTGKTSIARKMGEIFEAVGLLPTNRVIEVDKSQITGQYLGETPKIVNTLCDRAMGGILFIDEAYTLSAKDESGTDKYGKEAIDTLMKRMEDDKGKFVVIAAGYKDEMDEFLQTNPGLESRFTYKLHIDDYTEAELANIFRLSAIDKQYILTPEADEALVAKISSIYKNRKRNFGNAREMRKLLDAVVQNMSIRMSMLPPDEVTAETYQLIIPEDISSVNL